MNFSKKDDILLNSDSDLIFTRYLYIKEEVRLALLVSILNKSDDAIFWAYELYYSGFKFELLNLIWKIYYDFFATLNPTYESYLLKKYKELILNDNENQEDKMFSSIIQDLLFRPFNSDIFMLRNICENFEIDIIYHNESNIEHIEDVHNNIMQWVVNEDLRSIAQWILNLNKDIKPVVIYNICLDVFEKEFSIINCKQKAKLEKEFVSVIKLNIDTNITLLSKIIQLISKKVELKKGRSIYINVEPEDIILYETIIGSNEIKHYDILEKVYICGIDDLKHLSLFKLTRNKYNLQEEYWYRWEYHASFSPLWSKRIKQFGGYLDHIKKKVIFVIL